MTMKNKQTSEKRTLAVRVGKSVYDLDIDEPLTIDEMAFYLDRDRSYVHAMMRCGFEMPKHPVRRRAEGTYSEALKFFDKNPDFTFNKAYPKRN